MHYVRLLGDCVLLREHKVTLPCPEKELLIASRTGKYTQDRVFELGDDLTLECQQLMEDSELRDAVDVNPLSQRIADAYQSHWPLCASTDDGRKSPSSISHRADEG